MLLITHDLAVVAETTERIAVMYAGRIVENGTAEEVLLKPQHPYTQGLLTSIPRTWLRGERLNVIKGTVPNPFRMPVGCKFQPRCAHAFEPCKDFNPPLRELGPGRHSACWLQYPQAELPVKRAVSTEPVTTERVGRR